MRLKSLCWEAGKLTLLDQRKLPDTISYITCEDYRTVAEAIRTLAVRGAPAIGVSAAYAMVLAAGEIIKKGLTGEELKEKYIEAAGSLKSSRPTAVNLFWAIDEMNKVFTQSGEKDLYENLEKKAKFIEAQDKKTCSSISIYGADLFNDKKQLNILTHCNTGALATAGAGTALGVIFELHRRNQIECIYVDETRPLLQGARLTATELLEGHVPCQLITDNMAAFILKNKKIDAVIVGADRIAINGDAANKIGTYGLAVLCQYHHVPFYIAAPFSTFDFAIESGNDIKIEDRNPDEIRVYQGRYFSPKSVSVCNPAFDVTPHELITGIITERGVLTSPFDRSIKNFERSLYNE